MERDTFSVLGWCPTVKLVNFTKVTLTIGGSRRGVPGARPPTGPNSFVFAHIFTKKRRVGDECPLTGPHPATGNPGSATVDLDPVTLALNFN